MIPYTREFFATVTAGQENCVPLPSPPKGFLQRLVVKQVTGANAGFSFNLYDRRDACAIYQESSQVDEDYENTMVVPEAHQLQATQTVAAAQTTSQQYGLWLAYENRDERLKESRRLTPAIYLSLTPSGTGLKKFAIGYSIAQVTTR